MRRDLDAERREVDRGRRRGRLHGGHQPSRRRGVGFIPGAQQTRLRPPRGQLNALLEGRLTNPNRIGAPPPSRDLGADASGSNPGSKLSATEPNSEQLETALERRIARVRLDRSGWGPGGRRFKSCLPDHERPANAGLSPYPERCRASPGGAQTGKSLAKVGRVSGCRRSEDREAVTLKRTPRIEAVAKDRDAGATGKPAKASTISPMRICRSPMPTPDGRAPPRSSRPQPQ